MGKVFTIAMHKGGAGKTTLLTNLVGGLSVQHPDKRFLIVDTDSQANALMAFGGSPQEFPTGVHNLFLGDRPVEDTVYKLMENIDIIPATDEMDFIEFDVLLDDERRNTPFDLLDEAIGRIKENYDYVFIDTPPSMNLITGNALKVSDEVIIPFQPETYGVNGIMKVLKTITDLNDSLDTNITVAGVVGMMVDRQTSLHNILVQDARKYCSDRGIKMFDTIIPKSIRFANATAFHGLPATMIETRNRKKELVRHHIVDSYFELMDEMFEKARVTNE
jgi:chromosome partitioning protein